MPNSREDRDRRPATEGQPPLQTFEMEDSHITVRSMGGSAVLRTGHLAGMARHTLGLLLLLVVVFLWTLSNFLGSSIFADASYAKPFFLTYLNTSTFILCIVPTFGEAMYYRHQEGHLTTTMKSIFSRRMIRFLWKKNEGPEESREEEEAFLKPSTLPTSNPVPDDPSSSKSRILSEHHLGMLPTARLALAFCFLWFAANYFAMTCLQYTTVASTTVLTSTSSVWTLLVGAATGTEKFTWRKLCGVLASLAGIILISQVDLGANSDQPSADESKPAFYRRALNDFPDKTPAELLLGDALALLSAIIYGFYTITLKQTTLSVLPKSIHMPTFFGLVGIFNIILLFPLFPILHFTGLETFALPPNLHIWMVLLVNSASSLLSDICWAYAMVFTSPLVVTVGLSLTIPLSLIGEMIIQGRFESWVYWVGAMIVVGSFVFVEREEKHEEEEEEEVAAVVAEQIFLDEGEPGPAISSDGDEDDYILDDDDEPPESSGRRASAQHQEGELLDLVDEDDNVRRE